MRDTVVFNDVVISDFYEVIDVVRPFAGRTNSTQSVSGMNGARITGSSLNQNRLTVVLLMSDVGTRGRREAVRKLSGMLYTDKPSKLLFGSDDGMYYMAILDGDVPFVERVRTGRVEINFVTEEPMLYGKRVSYTVPSGGTLRVKVSGTYPARPVISGLVTSDPTNTLWGIRLDEGDYIRLDTKSTEPRNVTIDCSERVAYVEEALALPTLDSDWLELRAGTHTIRNDVGSGACMISWQERWI